MHDGGRQNFDCTLPAMANLENNQPAKPVKSFEDELLARMSAMGAGDDVWCNDGRVISLPAASASECKLGNVSGTNYCRQSRAVTNTNRLQSGVLGA